MLLLKLCAIAVLLSFSYRIFERVLGLVAKTQVRYTIYYWGAAMIGASILWKGSYTFGVPHQVMRVLPLFLVILAVNLIISRASGYNPVGTYNTVNFVLCFPIFEEIAFRGLVLPILAQHPVLGELHATGIIDVSGAILLTAFLFAVSHLQYYRLNRESVRFMLFALSGGIFFGLFAQVTESLVLTVALHIAFNGSAVWVQKKSHSSSTEPAPLP
ncbi:CPBP family intramembrane glutamic endopeptidase [Paenibacillus piscarius]|uniref:CPBP family intramembrane glutamic endopeptidase n=1 Tax=Paenibacillus piscarius TaxID=1089681 RepID=UPI001EE99053|nr:CPBP family intramembrane glutamic endopeptidase [Paenibacillus piscarius]